MSHGQQYSGVAVAEVITIQGISSPAQSFAAELAPQPPAEHELYVHRYACVERFVLDRRHEHPHHRRSREIRRDAVHGLLELRDEVPLAFAVVEVLRPACAPPPAAAGCSEMVASIRRLHIRELIFSLLARRDRRGRRPAAVGADVAPGRRSFMASGSAA